MRQLSSIAKTEIVLSPLPTSREKIAFLSAFFRVSGALLFSDGTKAYALKVEKIDQLQEILHELLASMDKDAFSYDIYSGQFIFKGEPLEELLDKLGIFVLDINGEANYTTNIDEDFLTSEDTRLATLRGFFAGAGSISMAKGYHLEFSFFSGFLASDCTRILKAFGLDAKVIGRNQKHVVYLKSLEAIGDTLMLLGAHDAALRLSNESASRESASLVNRRMNCDLRNIDKQVELAAKQTEAIRYLLDNNLISDKDVKLLETAHLRLAHPDAPLSEFAVLLKVSKSGARHRLDKLVTLYNEANK